MEINFETHYERITVQIEALMTFTDPFPGIIESSLETYSVKLFSEDWLNNKGYDWELYLSTLLDKSTECFQKLKDFVSDNKELEDIFFVSSAEVEKENVNLIDMFRVASGYGSQIQDLIIELQECVKFFERNKDLPPYSIKVNKVDKIPFQGGLNEFALLYYLITKSNFVLQKGNNKKFKIKELGVDLSKKIENYHCLYKTDLTKLFAQYFYGVGVENGEVVEMEFSPETLYKKSGEGSLLDIGIKTIQDFNNRLEIMRSELKDLMEKLETNSHFNVRTTK